jgi:hypothetical protein
MTRERFWSIVAQVQGDEAQLEQVLSFLEPSEIESFQVHFDELHALAYRWDLWGAAFIMEGGCSDDGFMDFRYALIALGREWFEAALKDPDSLCGADGLVSNELYGYAARKAYERASGHAMPSRVRARPTEPAGEHWDFSDERENRRRLPRISAQSSRL